MEDALLVFENNVLKIRELKVKESEYRKTATDFFAQPEGEWKEVECQGIDMAHVGVLQNFADAVDKKAELFIPGVEGEKSLKLSNAMYLSSWNKKMIMIPQNRDEELAFEQEYENELSKKTLS